MKSKATIYGIIAILLLGVCAFVFIYKRRGSEPSVPTAEIPVGWPAGVPFHPQAKFQQKISYGEAGDRFNLVVTVPDDQVRKYYEEEFKKNGWKVANVTPDGWQVWIKNEQKVGIQVIKNGADSNLAVMVYNTKGDLDPDPNKIKTIIDPAGGQPKVFPREKNPGDPDLKPGEIGEMPHDIPVYKGLESMGNSFSGDGNVTYNYTSKASYKELTDYYHTTMLAQGWELWAETSVKEGKNLVFQEIYKKGEVSVAVRIRPKDPREVVYIVFPIGARIPQIFVTQKSEMPMIKDPKTSPKPENKRTDGASKGPTDKPSTPNQ